MPRVRETWCGRAEEKPVIHADGSEDPMSNSQLAGRKADLAARAANGRFSNVARAVI